MIRRLVASLLVAMLVLLGPAMAGHAASMAVQYSAISEHRSHHGESCSPAGNCVADLVLCEFVCFGQVRFALAEQSQIPVNGAAWRFVLPEGARGWAYRPVSIDHPPKRKFSNPQLASPAFLMV